MHLRILLAFIFIFMSSRSLARHTSQKQKSDHRFFYVTNTVPRFHAYNRRTNSIVGDPKFAYDELKFNVVNSTVITIDSQDYYLIDFLPIVDEEDSEGNTDGSDENEPLKGNHFYINSCDNEKYFVIRISEFDAYENNGDIYKFYRTTNGSLSVITGVNLMTPFKYRPTTDGVKYVFDPEIQLGGYVGYKWRLSHDENPSYLNLPIVSFGFSSVTINDNAQIKKDGSNGTAGALTASVGAVFQTQGDFQLGFLIGWDAVPGQIGANWLYNERPWYSVGIGYSFLGGSKAESKKDEKIAGLPAKSDLFQIAVNPNGQKNIEKTQVDQSKKDELKKLDELMKSPSPEGQLEPKK